MQTVGLGQLSYPLDKLPLAVHRHSSESPIRVEKIRQGGKRQRINNSGENQRVSNTRKEKNRKEMGNKTQGSSSKCLFFFFSGSLSLNLLLLYLSFGRQSDRLTWTRTAALEAEAVASLSCSGHGRAFLDGIGFGSSQGEPACECYGCYGGSDCSELLPDCPADADRYVLLFTCERS